MTPERDASFCVEIHWIASDLQHFSKMITPPTFASINNNHKAPANFKKKIKITSRSSVAHFILILGNFHYCRHFLYDFPLGLRQLHQKLPSKYSNLNCKWKIRFHYSSFSDEFLKTTRNPPIISKLFYTTSCNSTLFLPFRAITHRHTILRNPKIFRTSLKYNFNTIWQPYFKVLKKF